MLIVCMLMTCCDLKCVHAWWDAIGNNVQFLVAEHMQQHRVDSKIVSYVSAKYGATNERQGNSLRQDAAAPASCPYRCQLFQRTLQHCIVVEVATASAILDVHCAL